METIEVINNQIKITTPISRYITIDSLKSQRDRLQLELDKIDAQILEAVSQGVKTQAVLMEEKLNLSKIK